MKKISVVIGVWNEEKFIRECLKSINNQTLSRKDYEIIVVDGGSTDRTVAIAKKYANVVLDSAYRPLGAARQAGLKKAKGRIVAFTDGDSMVPKDWLETIVRAFDNPEVVCAMGPVKCLEKDVPLSIRMAISAWVNSAKFFALINMGGAIGPNFAVNKERFMSIGGFRKIQIEDTDASFRLSKIGKLKYLDKIPVKSSVRRFKKWGVLKTLTKGLIGNLQVFSGRTPSIIWEKTD